MSTPFFSRGLSIGIFTLVLLCGVSLLPGVAGADAASTDDLRALVARDDWVLVRVELASAPAAAGVSFSAAEAMAQENAVADLLFALPEGSYADVERITDGSTLVMRVDALGLNGLLVSGTVTSVTPAVVPAAMQRVAAGWLHTVAVKPDGSLWTWGHNWDGQLGDGNTTDRATPVLIMNGVTAVTAGDNHTVALKIDGSLWAWGDNWKGQLGDGTTTDRSSPRSVMNGVGAIAAGVSHTLALRTDGSVWAWGWNIDGQIGDGTTTDRSRPVVVMNGVSAIAGGGWHTLALKTDGTLWLWGSKSHGQLGDGAHGWGIYRTTPAYLMNGVVAAAAGASHTLALKANGSLWAWGNNEEGQLGDGTTRDRFRPIRIMDGVAAIAAGSYHTLALKRDGSLWAWGNNGSGELGDGTRTHRYSPIHVMNGVAAAAGGGSHTLGLKIDGSLWAWGDGYWGQLGNGTTTPRLRPARVSGFGPVLKPAAPTNLAAKAISGTQINLTWQDNSSNEQGFRIERKIGTAPWVQIARVAADTTSFANRGLTPNTNYRYRVRAFNAGGTSAYATSTAVKTPR